MPSRASCRPLFAALAPPRAMEPAPVKIVDDHPGANGRTPTQRSASPLHLSYRSDTPKDPRQAKGFFAVAKLLAARPLEPLARVSRHATARR